MLGHNYEWVRLHGAAELWEIGGEAESSTVLNTLHEVWTENRSAANKVAACLNRMGPAAKPFLPQLHEELQRVSRAIIQRLT